jgi:hypothetical protein
MAEEQVEHRRGEREAADLAREPAQYLVGRPTSPSERPSRFVDATVRGLERVTKVDDQGVEVVGEAPDGDVVAGMLEL